MRFGIYRIPSSGRLAPNEFSATVGQDGSIEVAVDVMETALLRASESPAGSQPKTPTPAKKSVTHLAHFLDSAKFGLACLAASGACVSAIMGTLPNLHANCAAQATPVAVDQCHYQHWASQVQLGLACAGAAVGLAAGLADFAKSWLPPVAKAAQEQPEAPAEASHETV